jgi:hypothetical protein
MPSGSLYLGQKKFNDQECAHKAEIRTDLMGGGLSQEGTRA